MTCFISSTLHAARIYNMPQFSHLHVHSQYSLLDGASSIESLFAKAAAHQMPALAITDHGNMFGVFEFVKQAWSKTKVTGKDKNGNDIKVPLVKPIVGCEFYVVEDRFRKSFSREQKDSRYHQVLLAKNSEGYANLVKLTSMGYTEGYYSKYPRIDKTLIARHKEGLIATTCCIGAYVPQAILHLSEEEAEKEFCWWHEQFGEDYFIELQRHQIPDQEKINTRLIQYAQRYGVPVIATNDSHYTDREDSNAHDILLCINTGEKQSTPGYDDFVNDDVQLRNRRFKFPNNNFYFKDPEEMASLFSDIPEAIDNTNLVVDRVEYLNLNKDILLPAFPIPANFQIHTDNNLNQWEYLKHITYEGGKNRYGELSQVIIERIDFELFTIKTMGFAGYFLIVADFIKAGRDKGVFIGPGRGSAAGSVVAYCIGITNIDPIKYNLLFERFLNPDRKSMPDIDTDFDDEGRQKVIDYVVDKYGKNQVAQIVTYGTMAARSSIKDVARVLDLPLSESNMLSKLVPERPGASLKTIFHAPFYSKDGEKSLESLGYDGNDIKNAQLLRDIKAGTDLRASVLSEAEKLEGSVRNTGVHAAGIIIAPKNLMELIPVAVAKDSDLWVTQIEGSVIEESGVIKMDFLGLKTLSILKTALEIIKERQQKEIDLDALPLDDNKTYQLYHRGETNGTFQFESVGMQKYLRELKPDQFEDLIAMNALYRPGPLAYIPNFIARKHGREEIKYDLPEMQEFLEETYGITVYQEQVMLLSQKLAGFSKGQADTLRKAMGKKDRKTLDKMKDVFIVGASEKGFAKEILEKIWTDWEAFAQYAFNKSHSTCYAFVAYQTAYLKAHYPPEYMAAVLNHSGSIEKTTFFMEECKRMGITVLGPDINESNIGFAVNDQGQIRFGLGGLKGVGEAAVENIISERKRIGPFLDIYDFSIRVNQRTVNKKTFESLAYGGAFDCFKEIHRAQYFYVGSDQKSGIEKLINFAQQVSTSKTLGAHSLFGESMMPEIAKPAISSCQVWTLTEQLHFEKEVCGIYLSGHPLDHFRFEMKYYNITKLAEFKEIKESLITQPSRASKIIRLAGLVTEVSHRTSKNGRMYGMFTIEDYESKTEVTLWADDYVRFQNYMESGKMIVVTGYFKMRYNKTDEYEFKVTQISLLESIKEQMTKQLELYIEPASLSLEMISFLDNNLRNYPGNTSLRFTIFDPVNQLKIYLVNREKGLQMNDELAKYLLNNPDMTVQVELSN
jgi:DNA polymerase-3 subunit alpha